MKNMKNTMIKMTAMACIAGFGAVASANSVTMKYVGNTGLNTVSLYNSTLNTTTSHPAGHLTYQFQSGGAYNTFCIETAQYTNTGYRTYEIINLADAPSPGASYGQAAADRVIAVIANAVDLGWIDINLQAAPSGGMSGEDNADRMSAIQGAIWAALFNNLTPSSTDTDVVNNLATLGAQSLNNATFNLMKNRLRAAVNDGAQDQLYIVPLPTSAMAGLGLLGGIAGVRSIRRRRA